MVVEDQLPLLDELKELRIGYTDEVCVTIPLSNSVDDEGDGEIERMQKALAGFQEVVVPALGKPSGLDPFVNQTPRVAGAYAHVKLLLLLPLLLVRLLLVGVILVVGYVATKVALAGWEGSSHAWSGHVVLPKWRRKLMGVTRLCGRGLLWCFGYVPIAKTRQKSVRNSITCITISLNGHYKVILQLSNQINLV